MGKRKMCAHENKRHEGADRDSYLVRTMETASLRMLSPNTSILRTGSTLRALKMAMVATGSTAEISEPKAKLQWDQRERERE